MLMACLVVLYPETLSLNSQPILCLLAMQGESRGSLFQQGLPLLTPEELEAKRLQKLSQGLDQLKQKEVRGVQSV